MKRFQAFVTGVLAVLLLAAPGCTVLDCGDGGPVVINEQRCERLGRLAALAYLAERPNLDEDERQAFAVGYAAIHGALQVLAGQPTAEWTPYVEQLLVAQVENETYRRLLLLLFEDAVDELTLYIEQNYGEVAQSDVLRYLNAVDRGVQTELAAAGISMPG